MRKIRKQLKDIMDTLTAGEEEQAELSRAIEALAVECGIMRGGMDDIDDGLNCCVGVHRLKEAFRLIK